MLSLAAKILLRWIMLPHVRVSIINLIEFINTMDTILRA